jgi:hypothetical protein
LVESDQEEMVQASDSEMQVQLCYSFSLPLRKFFTFLSKYSENFYLIFLEGLLKENNKCEKIMIRGRHSNVWEIQENKKREIISFPLTPIKIIVTI